MNEVTFEERRAVYKKAAATYGPQAQTMMAVEEMSELTKTICKFFRGTGYLDPRSRNIVEEKIREPLVDSIAEECADVMIMMEQLCYIFQIDEEVRRYMDEKVNRLAGRLGMF